MDVRAAVALAPGKPLSIETVQLEGPKAGEVLVEIKATGLCATPTGSPSPATTRKASSPRSWATRVPASSSTSARA